MLRWTRVSDRVPGHVHRRAEIAERKKPNQFPGNWQFPGNSHRWMRVSLARARGASADHIQAGCGQNPGQAQRPRGSETLSEISATQCFSGSVPQPQTRFPSLPKRITHNPCAFLPSHLHPFVSSCFRPFVSSCHNKEPDYTIATPARDRRRRPPAGAHGLDVRLAGGGLFSVATWSSPGWGSTARNTVSSPIRRPMRLALSSPKKGGSLRKSAGPHPGGGVDRFWQARGQKSGPLCAADGGTGPACGQQAAVPAQSRGRAARHAASTTPLEPPVTGEEVRFLPLTLNPEVGWSL